MKRLDIVFEKTTISVNKCGFMVLYSLIALGFISDQVLINTQWSGKSTKVSFFLVCFVFQFVAKMRKHVLFVFTQWFVIANVSLH